MPQTIGTMKDARSTSAYTDREQKFTGLTREKGKAEIFLSKVLAKRAQVCHNGIASVYADERNGDRVFLRRGERMNNAEVLVFANVKGGAIGRHWSCELAKPLPEMASSPFCFTTAAASGVRIGLR